MRDVRRMAKFNVTYLFTDIDAETGEIVVKGKTSPPLEVPFWLIKSAFPVAAIRTLQKFCNLQVIGNNI